MIAKAVYYNCRTIKYRNFMTANLYGGYSNEKLFIIDVL